VDGDDKKNVEAKGSGAGRQSMLVRKDQGMIVSRNRINPRSSSYCAGTM
jgi:hypothetical protein